MGGEKGVRGLAHFWCCMAAKALRRRRRPPAWAPFTLLLCSAYLCCEEAAAATSPAEVLLVSQATENLTDYAEITQRINARYAARHAYGFVGTQSEEQGDSAITGTLMRTQRSCAGRSERLGARP